MRTGIFEATKLVLVNVAPSISDIQVKDSYPLVLLPSSFFACKCMRLFLVHLTGGNLRVIKSSEV